MPYTSEKPKLTPSRSELEQRIPGWGADLDPKNRPAVPKERWVAGKTGAHWDFPERQVPRWERERTPEHKFLTPVFGTACPPKGLSGVVRRYAYKYSEGRSAHWLLLMLADRIDVVESLVGATLRGQPDNFLAEYGLAAELKRNGVRSRLGRHRADVKRLPFELLFFGASWLAIGGLLRLARKRRVPPPRRRLLLGRAG
jgi:hypothetical protein